jgi:hypothetical protein
MALTLIENFRAVFYTPFYAAFALNAYEAEGVEVQRVMGTSPADTAQALRSGRGDVAWGGPIRLLLDNNQQPHSDLVIFCEVVRRDPLALDPSARQPTRHRPLVIAKRHDNRLQWTPMGHQGHHQADRLRRGPQAIQCGAFRGAERLVALRAQEALVLTRVDTNVALACLASGGAHQIGAECGGGVHAFSSPGVAGEHAKKEYVWTPIFIATAPHHGLVGSYPCGSKTDKTAYLIQFSSSFQGRYANKRKGQTRSCDLKAVGISR